nr:MAG TPA: hypothetical protein [Bacteriophage sp.]
MASFVSKLSKNSLEQPQNNSLFAWSSKLFLYSLSLSLSLSVNQ